MGGGRKQLQVIFSSTSCVCPFCRTSSSKLLLAILKLSGRTTSSDIGTHKKSLVRNSSPKIMKNGLRG